MFPTSPKSLKVNPGEGEEIVRHTAEMSQCVFMKETTHFKEMLGEVQEDIIKQIMTQKNPISKSREDTNKKKSVALKKNKGLP